MGFSVLAGLLAASLASGGGQEGLPMPPQPTAPTAAAAPASANKMVQLTRVVLGPPTGTVYAALTTGMFCGGGRSLVWTAGPTDQKIGPYLTPFHDQMVKAGVRTQGDPGNLFENASGEGAAAEFSVGALITNMQIKACQPDTTGPNLNNAKGSAAMSVEWQVFSRLSREVVAKITTQATFDLPAPVPGGIAVLNTGAFGANAAKLAASPAFRQAIAGRALVAGEVLHPEAKQAPIALAGALAAPHRSVADETGSVVLIYAGDGSGSGFLVSDDGYFLTDSHVVGEAHQVRLRWPDGKEELGEVVRIAKGRDVALIKADAQGHRPLPLRRDLPGPGETVLSIGAPLGRNYEGTVTRGVVSAKRVIEGFTFLQSDITVNPGSSGGPLTDESGRVVGLTRGGIRTSGGSTGINFFIPVGDALDFLALEPR